MQNTAKQFIYLVQSPFRKRDGLFDNAAAPTQGLLLLVKQYSELQQVFISVLNLLFCNLHCQLELESGPPQSNWKRYFS